MAAPDKETDVELEQEIIISPSDESVDSSTHEEKKPVPLATYNERGSQMVVRKSNELIQLPVYKLSLMQQKLMLHIFAMIRQEDTELPEYEMTIYEFLKLCNLNTASGSTYKYIKKALEDLVNIKAEWIQQPGTPYMETFRWIDKVRINPETGKIHIILDRVLKPHLIQLKSFYTTMNITYTLPMKSQYSIHMYELLKSYQHFYLKEKQKNRPYVIRIDQLLEQLDAPYKKWTDIRRYILDRAKSEINGHTDIIFDYSIYEKTRKVVSIAVTIESVPKDEQANILIQIQSKYSKKAKKAMKAVTNEFSKGAKADGSILTLSYVSSPESTIPYHIGANKEEMIKELIVRAEQTELQKELSAEEMDAVNLIINLMATAAGTIKPGDKDIDGANGRYIEMINDVILHCKSMKKWFAGIAKRYADNIIPLSRTKKDPAAYLSHIIQADLENYRIYTIQKASPEEDSMIEAQLSNLETAEPVLEQDAADENTASQAGNSKVQVKKIEYEDAVTKKHLIARLKELMHYETLIQSLTSTQQAALDDSINLIAALCRRNRKGKDDEYMVGKANTQYIDPLNRFIKTHDSLDELFNAIAHIYDYSVFWAEISKDKKVNDPKGFFAYKIEQTILYPDMALTSFLSKQQENKQKQTKTINWSAAFDDFDDDVGTIEQSNKESNQ